MQKIVAKYNSLFAVTSLFAAVLLRLLMLLFNLKVAFGFLFYFFCAMGILLLSISSFGRKDYPNAFDKTNSRGTNISAYCASLGFFANFVYQCVDIFYKLNSNITYPLIYYLPAGVVCVTAFLSSLYFVLVGLSFGNSNYDFKQLKMFHVIPLFWAIFNGFSVLTQAANLTYDIDTVVKYLVLIFMVCFLYSFISEIDSNGRTSSKTIFFAQGLVFVALVFVCDRIILVALGDDLKFGEDFYFSVSSALIGIFAFSFEKNISKRQ